MTAALNNVDCTEIKLGSNIETTGKLYVERTVTLGEKRFLLLHGHQCAGELAMIYKARMAGAQAVCFGHSHIPFLTWEEGILLLNPGSLSRPRGCSQPGCALLTVENGDIVPKLLSLLL